MKYAIPEGVSLKPGQTARYKQETILIFIDIVYGEFKSTFRAFKRAGNKSTHPKAIQNRKKAILFAKYGVSNPSQIPGIREKAQNTMLKKYGVKNALESKEFLDKSKATLKSNYGVENPMHNQTLKDKKDETFKLKYGVSNPMHSEEIKSKQQSTNIAVYGYKNPMQNAAVKEKFLNNITQNDFSSGGELEIKDFVRSLGIDCKKGYIGGAEPKEIDILIKDLSIGIEYNGLYWHHCNDKYIGPSYHKRKMELAKEQGIKLIQIWDDEWLKRSFQIKSFLKSMLGKNEIRVGARNCEIKEVGPQTTKEFLEKYHILGSCNFSKSLGLYYKEELISLITIGKHHRNHDEWVLSRYVVKENHTISGGLTRLCNKILETYPLIYTWIDLRFSNGDNWLKNGWELVFQLPPDYFYYDKKTHKVIKKQARKKKVVKTPENMTEKQHALIDGLVQVYDCGKLKLKLKK